MRILLPLAAVVLAVGTARAATFTKVTSFGANPGALAAYEYVPDDLPDGAPLVVVLHGCTQTASAMRAAGWEALAEEHGFAVLYPEQQTANNPVRCFNWAGEYGDTANLVRGQGENQSIISMIDREISVHGVDRSRVYLAGFSAGGGFAAVLLATWPDRFAGVSIMSGLPYRCATSVAGAFTCQNPGTTKTAQQWGDLVRGAFTFAGPYPRVQIWHGTADSIVNTANGDELVKQWTNVHGTDATADETEAFPNVATRTAFKKDGVTVVELYKVTGMGHGVALGTDPDGTACPATAGAYFLQEGICSTVRAARFFGLLDSSGGGSGSGSGDPSCDDLDANTRGAGVILVDDGCSAGAGAGWAAMLVLGVALIRRRRPTTRG